MPEHVGEVRFDCAQVHINLNRYDSLPILWLCCSNPGRNLKFFSDANASHLSVTVFVKCNVNVPNSLTNPCKFCLNMRTTRSPR